MKATIIQLNHCAACVTMVLLLMLGNNCFSQTLPVGLLNTEDFFRREQLLDNDSVKGSFMIRPLLLSNLSNLGRLKYVVYNNDKLRSEFSILPLVIEQQFNSDRPFGINDGSMILARGYQSRISVGFFGKIGPLSLQVRPDYVYAENRKFRTGADLLAQKISTPILNNGNRVDLPERFGNGQYSKVNLGQSSLRLTFNPVSLGLSNENLWWGPGRRNSLLMTNNSSGFNHVTLNTSAPIKTLIGTFESQIVGGRLEPSGVPIPANSSLKEKSKDWTYFSGFVMTYQPKWIPNLFLGFDRAFIVSRANMGNRFIDYFPFFSPIEKAAFDQSGVQNGPGSDDLAKRDQYISAFARWVFPETHAEVYFQYGRNDHAYDKRDLFIEPEHSMAYVGGFRKLVPLSDAFLSVAVEATHLEGSQTGAIRAQPTWYVHSQVPNGYTNMGQFIGAGIGPGSNTQSVEISWVKGLKTAGIEVGRFENGVDLSNNAKSKAWVDFAVGGLFDWEFNRFLLSSKLTYIHSNNYQYLDERANNLQFKIGLLYNFNK